MSSSPAKAQNMGKVFSLVPSKKTSTRENIDKLMPYPCSHIYFDIKFNNKLYSKAKRRILSVVKNIYQTKSDYMNRAFFVCWQVFLREREKLFYKYSGLSFSSESAMIKTRKWLTLRKNFFLMALLVLIQWGELNSI